MKYKPNYWTKRRDALRKKYPGFYILRPHVKGCSALKQECWQTPWGVIKETYRSGGISNPKKRGCEHWFTVGCNSIRCNGILAVRMADILFKAPHGDE